MNESGKLFLTEKVLIKTLQESGLSVGSIYFLLKDLTNQFNFLYKQQGQKELSLFREEQEKQQTEKEENSSTSQD